MRKVNSAAGLKSLRERITAGRSKSDIVVTVCGGPGCQASRCGDVVEAVREGIENNGVKDKVRLRVTGCHGFCEQGPIMVIDPAGIFYCRLKPADVDEIISATIERGKTVERLLYTDPDTGKKVAGEKDIPFYKAQDMALLSRNRHVDPCSIDDYIAVGGYTALAKALLEMEPGSIIAEITGSGLRGRGGGGFPTGRKWASCRKAAGEEKYVICNADEGDPGAYMDRGVLEGNPHSVIEGMIIGSRAVGSRKGYIYVRNEYPLTLEHARIAVRQAREYGFLGNKILGSGHSFDIEIARGGGAFVCGESTALMASLEGKVGEPRPKDVHTVEEGLWNKPTLLNNVETWANVPAIINNGSGWFAHIGSEGSKGTKILSLTGRVRNTGLVEVAMGTPISKVVYDIGGGASDGNTIKAVQTGGPSGGCLPADMFDLPIDFDKLYEAGSMVGSGGLVVMDEKTCMVDVARYFLAFLQDESCGKCVPCRIGIDRMLEIVTGITEGKGSPEQIDLLEELAWTVSEASLCALGKTAANPVLSTLKYFREEYEAHILDGKCPAGVCSALIEYSIDGGLCNGCGACLRLCPYGAVSGEKKQPHVIDGNACRKCGICSGSCALNAISAH